MMIFEKIENPSWRADFGAVHHILLMNLMNLTSKVMILMIFEKMIFLYNKKNVFCAKNRGRKSRRVGIGHNKELMDPATQKTILIYFCTNG